MITLTVLFLTLTVVFKIAGDNSPAHKEFGYYSASCLCGALAIIFLVVMAVTYHGDAIEYFFQNY